MKSLFNLYQWALEYVRDGGRNDDYLAYWQNLPNPSQVIDQRFFGEMAWCIYNAGMAERIVRVKWPALKDAFCGFDSWTVVRAGPACIESIDQAVAVIRHRGKAQAVFDGAMKIVADGLMGKRLRGCAPKALPAGISLHRLIGAVTR